MASAGSIGMPPVGMGFWKVPREQTADVLYEAISAGYRHLDFACDYGNEKECGEGIRRAISAGLCTRQELFITSKLWNTYHRREHVPLACQRSLDDLGLDYVDLYLIHFPISLPFVPFEESYPPEWTDKPGNAGVMRIDPVPYRETWEAMEALKLAGKAKHIGVSNLNCFGLMDVLSYCQIKPAVNQVEMHPYNTQESLLAFCKEHGVVVAAFSPLGAGSYVGIGLAEASENVLVDPVVTGIAAAHGKTTAQVCLRFLTQRDVPVIAKSLNPGRMRENLVSDFNLSESDIGALKGLNRNRRFNDPGHFTKGMGMPNGYPIHA
uniref:NADP-dependent oxidoreductase domain-containing protein n=1 Tax=Noctiluca scintillans TaxID=2966 RepID=A0A7S0ZQ58_NOCSC|mmetsp:Transcript_14351/g.39128  ORF Transcript_14351/g.39128 Transcript_14351/m.39128 type:complete len:322 (+) Transcript_14351:69-1034(+)|eukprot:CAMPEP_0194478450 /NCGR_PEP_ID=MMETSP0253-20130528/1889_1 /TAXON_ID=2966 /ORGANISM="Noctiluca scintillans" /LENGTH=321 /DNA_ID=CAMNT_0039317535 /DNA_START=63 /DNA_END=1028 /DNA_ORIENTATION=-